MPCHSADVLNERFFVINRSFAQRTKKRCSSTHFPNARNGLGLVKISLLIGLGFYEEIENKGGEGKSSNTE